jgi:hypothetical protein
MKKPSRVALTAVALCIGCQAIAGAQQKPEKSPNPARLELTAEVATTTEEGYPAVLRITLTNAGNVAVDMPMPGAPCVPGGGGVEVRAQWSPTDPKDLRGGGSTGTGCTQEHFPSLTFRVSHQWIRLRPGEFITVSEDIRQNYRNWEPGRIEYWAEYIPPKATPEELVELRQAGYVVPAEKIETLHQTFVVH